MAISTLHELAPCKWLNWSTKALTQARIISAGKVELGGVQFDHSDIIVRDRDPSGMTSEVVAFDHASHLYPFKRYNPLVYYTVFGAHLFRLMQISMESIIAFGAFDGDFLVISDKDREQVLSWVPESIRGRTKVWYQPAQDVLDITTSRYRIHRWPEASKYQPFLYLDSDVIVDAPLDHVLVDIACQDRLCFQGEPGDGLSTHYGVGRRRFEEAGIDVQGKYGYNSGIMGIPSLASTRADLECIEEGTYRYAVAKGTRDLEWSDQASGNYILYVLDRVEKNILHRAVRWGGRDALHGGAQARGFVHLWGGAKEEEMEDLLTMLRQAPRAALVPWTVYSAAEGKQLVEQMHPRT